MFGSFLITNLLPPKPSRGGVGNLIGYKHVHLDQHLVAYGITEIMATFAGADKNFTSFTALLSPAVYVTVCDCN